MTASQLGIADEFGYALATIGDVDGDSIRDLAISAPGWGPFAPVQNVGRVEIRSGADGAFISSFD